MTTLAIALLALGLSLAGQNEASAAAASIPGAAASQLADHAGIAMTPVRGWWAVPAIIGGVVLFHHFAHRHPRRCYRHCRRYHGPRYCRRACW